MIISATTAPATYPALPCIFRFVDKAERRIVHITDNFYTIQKCITIHKDFIRINLLYIKILLRCRSLEQKHPEMKIDTLIS
jgi:hypothetical protein